MRYKLLTNLGLSKIGDILKADSWDAGIPYGNHWLLSPADVLLMLKAGLLEEADKKWEPKEGEKYWYITSFRGQIIASGEIWSNHDIDRSRYQESNFFPTEAEAIKAREAIRALLADMKK